MRRVMVERVWLCTLCRATVTVNTKRQTKAAIKAGWGTRHDETIDALSFACPAHADGQWDRKDAEIAAVLK